MSTVSELMMGNLSNLQRVSQIWAGIIYNVKDYKAKGDGITDDTAAIQSAVDACALTGGTVVYPGGTYLVSSTIYSQNLTSLKAQLPGSGIHFTDNHEINHVSYAGARIVATSPMENMYVITNNTSKSLIAPFYSSIYGLIFDANNKVTNAVIKYNATFHGTVEKCRIFNANVGIFLNLSVGTQCLYNVIKATTGVYMTGGGDSVFYHNDIYPSNNGSGFYLGGFTGNSVFRDNVVSCEENTIVSGFVLDGTEEFNSPPVDGLIGNITIDANEFSGTSYGIRAFGKSTHKTVYNISIVNNHISAPFNNGGYRFIDAQYCYDFIIKNNFVNALSNYDMDSFGVLQGCDHMTVSGNKMTNLVSTAIDILNCNDCQILDNELHNYGKDSSAFSGIKIRGTSLRTLIERNVFENDLNTYATTAAMESDTSDYTLALNNVMRRNVFGYTFVGANTVMRRNEFSSSIPGTAVGYNIGDTAAVITPTSGGNIGWVLTSGGWKAYGTIA